MRVQQVIATNMHFIIPVAIIAGFGMVYNILGGAAGLLYAAGVVAAIYYYSQPGTGAKEAVVSQVAAMSFAEELVAEEMAEMEAEKQRSSKVGTLSPCLSNVEYFPLSQQCGIFPQPAVSAEFESHVPICRARASARAKVQQNSFLRKQLSAKLPLMPPAPLTMTIATMICST
jgi:hypothetical protein